MEPCSACHFTAKHMYTCVRVVLLLNMPTGTATQKHTDRATRKCGSRVFRCYSTALCTAHTAFRNHGLIPTARCLFPPQPPNLLANISMASAQVSYGPSTSSNEERNHAATSHFDIIMIPDAKRRLDRLPGKIEVLVLAPYF